MKKVIILTAIIIAACAIPAVCISVDRNNSEELEACQETTSESEETTTEAVTEETVTEETETETSAVTEEFTGSLLELEPLSEDCTIEEVEERFKFIDKEKYSWLRQVLLEEYTEDSEEYKKAMTMAAVELEKEKREELEGTQGEKAGELDETEPPATPTPEYNPPAETTQQSQSSRPPKPAGAVEWVPEANDWFDKYGLPITNKELRQYFVDRDYDGEDPKTTKGEGGHASPGCSLG